MQKNNQRPVPSTIAGMVTDLGARVGNHGVGLASLS